MIALLDGLRSYTLVVIRPACVDKFDAHQVPGDACRHRYTCSVQRNGIYVLSASDATVRAGFLWLGLFFYWGATWVRTPNDKPSRYTFWLVVFLLAAIHFALQLAAQILYMQAGEKGEGPRPLVVLGFPNKNGLQKLQVSFLCHKPSACMCEVIPCCTRSESGVLL